MLQPTFWPVFVAGCHRLGVDPVDLLAVAANESGCNAGAWNEGGRAAGLWQLTPAGAGAAGWPGDQTHRFSTLTAEEQWPFWERYFGLHREQLTSRAAAYVATYLPALLSLAGNPDALLCSKDGRTDAPHPERWSVEQRIGWYTGNKGFDHGRTGEIRVRDLTAAIDRSTLAMGGVWADYVAAIRKAQAMLAPVDVTDGGRDAPVYMAPEQPARDPQET